MQRIFSKIVVSSVSTNIHFSVWYTGRAACNEMESYKEWRLRQRLARISIWAFPWVLGGCGRLGWAPSILVTCPRRGCALDSGPGTVGGDTGQRTLGGAAGHVRVATSLIHDLQQVPQEQVHSRLCHRQHWHKEGSMGTNIIIVSVCLATQNESESWVLDSIFTF